VADEAIPKRKPTNRTEAPSLPNMDAGLQKFAEKGRASAKQAEISPPRERPPLSLDVHE
jgi:hypothetical protein